MLCLACFLCLCLCLCPPPHPHPPFSSACPRSLLACLLCCDFHPPDLDIPLPSTSCAARPSLAPLQGSVERPQTPLALHSGPRTATVQWGPLGVEATPGDGGSVAGLSCSTLTPSEGMDMRRLLRTPRRQRGALAGFCPSVAARLRRMNLSA